MCYLWQRVPLASQRTGEREQKALEGQALFRLVHIAGKAVKDAPQSLPMASQ